MYCQSFESIQCSVIIYILWGFSDSVISVTAMIDHSPLLSTSPKLIPTFRNHFRDVLAILENVFPEFRKYRMIRYQLALQSHSLILWSTSMKSRDFVMQNKNFRDGNHDSPESGESNAVLHLLFALFYPELRPLLCVLTQCPVDFTSPSINQSINQTHYQN
jgi:hypothetical protein